MCFSASASFVAGAVLMVAGIVSVSHVKKIPQLLFAGIPLFFGIQQCCEGFLWLSLTNADFAGSHTLAKYSFLFFAQVLWPFWIPLSFLLIERSSARKKVMRWLLIGGVLVSIMLTYRLLFFTALAHIEGCHIEYAIASTFFIKIITAVLYLAAIVVTPFLSSWKRSKVLASVNLVSLLVTELFFEVYFVSVWCFFAAVQSVIIVVVMREIRRSRR